MAMLRAVLDGCSTTGRSMLPALGASLSPWSIFVQSRGAKSAGRTVEICLLQVRFVVRAVVPRTIDHRSIAGAALARSSSAVVPDGDSSAVAPVRAAPPPPSSTPLPARASASVLNLNPSIDRTSKASDATARSCP